MIWGYHHLKKHPTVVLNQFLLKVGPAHCLQNECFAPSTVLIRNQLIKVSRIFTHKMSPNSGKTKGIPNKMTPNLRGEAFFSMTCFGGVFRVPNFHPQTWTKPHGQLTKARLMHVSHGFGAALNSSQSYLARKQPMESGMEVYQQGITLLQ